MMGDPMNRAAKQPGSPATAGPASPSNEAALLARLRSGDRAAFAELVRRHAGSLLRLARSLTRNEAVAEEAVQETWLAALDGLDRFEGRSSLRTWLFHILANKARTRAARERRSIPFSALADPDDGGAPSEEVEAFDAAGAWKAPPGSWSDATPERLAQDAETRAAVEAAIAGLPPGQRAVITLRDVEGLDADEICNVLAITVTNQRVLLHRARARVREALSRHLGGA
jgi:RNA polymerase sigma-70 factor (ECF subfamily)